MFQVMSRWLVIALFLPVITGFGNVAAETPLPPPQASLTVTGEIPSPPKALPWDIALAYAASGEHTKIPANLLPDSSSFKATVAPHSFQASEATGYKNYVLPVLEVNGFLALLNTSNRYRKDKKYGEEYQTSPDTTWAHLRRQNWMFDDDNFNINQFLHPYQGAVMYGLSRSAGLNFWESLVYSNLGSFAWEMAGERQRPAINDQFTTGNAGSFLGEALYRMADLVLKDGGPKPDIWHELGAFLISPASGVNRLAFGDRYSAGHPVQNPAKFWRLSLGASVNAHVNDLKISNLNVRDDYSTDFAIGYGLPGKPGYSYDRPFDYFVFQMNTRANASNTFENVMIRGLLLGKKYQAGTDYRGIWGLYGSYDYFSPYLFRVSTTGLSLGTTGQYWLAPGIAFQSTVLGGVGFGAAGTTLVTDGLPKQAITRDYHFGGSSQGLIGLRLIMGDRALADYTWRGYYVSGTLSDNQHGSETIFRGNAGLTLRIWDQHALGIQYVESIRHAKYGISPGRRQTEGTVSFNYTYLGSKDFGAVEWRDSSTP
jgi:hypothetical protein